MTIKIAIICPSTSIASKNIQECLIRIYGFKKIADYYELILNNKNIRIYSPPKESIFLENLDKEIEADLFIFATTHRSASGIPSLSAHIQGNWSVAELGGLDRKLCLAPANHIKEAIRLLEEYSKGLHYDIIQEVTHHGPYIEKPSFFIEIGSDEKEWVNKEAGEVIAKVIMILLSKEVPVCQTAVGIGGTHTMSNFKKIVMNSDIAIGHCCPKYMLEYLDKELLLQALDKTTPKPCLVIVDWKGLGPYKDKITSIIKELGVEWKKTKNF